MIEKIVLREKFKEYLNELEGFSFRSERLYDDLVWITQNPTCTSSKRMEIIVKWLEASYIAGAREMAQNSVDTLNVFSKMWENYNEVTYTREAAYEEARKALMGYYTKVLDEAENKQDE